MILSKAVVLGAAMLALAACETGPKSGGNVSGTGVAKAVGGWGPVARRCGGERVHFALDSYNLKPQARRIVECWASYFKSRSGQAVLIAGNADERGTREYNLGLADRRANSVKSYLVALGVQARRIRTISYGKERPVDPGSNEAAWAKNRNALASLPSAGS
jgi:peptidoglycan-associated lipoprotein